MDFVKNIFNSNENSHPSYKDFWTWFSKHSDEFHNVMKTKGDIEEEFLDKVSAKLSALNDELFFLAGIPDEDQAELIISAAGTVKHFVFIEELVAAAPQISGWKFTALLPALPIEDVSIEQSGYSFNKSNMHFYVNEDPDYLDEIDFTIVHDDLNEENRSAINNGIFNFLDNFLGELKLAVLVDNIIVEEKAAAEKQLIPISELNAYIDRRQNELEKKYAGTVYDSKNSKYNIVKTEVDGSETVAVINTDLLNWTAKTSHPWIFQIMISPDENDDSPTGEEYLPTDKFEDLISEKLENNNSCLKIGTQTRDDGREIYFACKDFRKPVQIFKQIQDNYRLHHSISSDIFLDKYWSTFNEFKPSV